jgi:hypothetical protein
MKKYTRALMVGVGAVLALGTFTACSSGTTEQAATTTETTPAAATTTAAAMPEMADFIAEVQKPDGSTMTMAIAVEGEKSSPTQPTAPTTRPISLVLRRTARWS